MSGGAGEPPREAALRPARGAGSAVKSSSPRRPRLSISFAMTSRWISEVPSQMRSTRSSRHSRSTGLSRM